MGKTAMRMSCVLALGIALTSLPTAASADAIKDFKKAFASKNSWDKANAIRTLDPNDKKAYKILSKLLSASDWYLRHAVIDVLSGAFEGEISAQMTKDLKKGKAVIAEAIALAIGKSSDPSKVPLLIEALKHKDWRVRRSAALALKAIPDKRSIEPLMDAWETELKKGKHFRVWVRCIETLEEITGEKKLTSLGDWRNWWEGAKSSFDSNEKKETKDSKSSTKVRGVKLDFETRGKGGTLLVVPEYGFEVDYLKTYLRNLEDYNRIIYMSLPGATDFNPALPNAAGAPYPNYPLEKISDAFEGLIKELIEKKTIKKGKINLFCHGMSSWIGMSFAAKYPGAVRRLVLCAPFSSQKAYGDGYQRHIKGGQASGDIEEEHWAKSNVLQGGTAQYTASGQDDALALQRKGFSVYFADVRDSEIKTILGPRVTKKVGNSQGEMFKAFRPVGSVMIPPFKVTALRKVPVRTMVMVGRFGKMTSVADCKGIVKHYPKGSLMVFPKSSRMPFIEENTKFVKAMAKFIN
jgi:pimeloyl-ACP methyl ester carboxylesterase